MSEHSNICYYCDGASNDSNINLMEGTGGYQNEERFRIICQNCFPQVQHRGGRSWSFCYKIKSKSEDISRIIKFYEKQDPI